MSAGGAEREARELALARELLEEIGRHSFIPGKYPDADYCSCGRRYGLYTKGDARVQQNHWHVPEAIATLLARCANDARLEALEHAACEIDKCNQEGPYQAIAGAERIRALKAAQHGEKELRKGK